VPRADAFERVIEDVQQSLEWLARVAHRPALEMELYIVRRARIWPAW